MTTKHSHGPNFGRIVPRCPRCIELVNGAEPVSASDRLRPDAGEKVTKHNHQVIFGRREPGCPRCTELDAGAKPVRWALSRREQDEQRAAEIRDHDCKSAGCSIVCTFGDW